MIPLYQPSVAYRTDHDNKSVFPKINYPTIAPMASGGVANAGGFALGPKFGLMPINDFYVPKRFELQGSMNGRLMK